MGSTAAATSSILLAVARTGCAREARACFLPRHAAGAGARSWEESAEPRAAIVSRRYATRVGGECDARRGVSRLAPPRAAPMPQLSSRVSGAQPRWLRNPSIRLVETIHLQLWISGDRRFFGGHRRSKSSTAPAQTERRRRHAPRFSRSSPWARSRRCHSRTHLSRPHAPRKHGLRHRRSRLPHRPRRHARQPQGDQAPHEDAAQEGARRASCASG